MVRSPAEQIREQVVSGEDPGAAWDALPVSESLQAAPQFRLPGRKENVTKDLRLRVVQ
jgi:hypothetical protein